MNDQSFISIELDFIEDKPHLFTALEINGVSELDGVCWVDNDSPQFYSVYARLVDGTCTVCGDASLDKLDALRTIAKQGADLYGWTVKDFTVHPDFN